MQHDLISKYNVPGPRYTSYPTVPDWDTTPSENDWRNQVRGAFSAANSTNGISLYLHLPYCESLCTYCGCNTRITVNHAVELPYIEALLKEWDAYRALFDQKPRISQLHLGGGTPTFFKPENLHTLLSRLLADTELVPDAEFGFEGHPRNTTREHLQVLRDLGFNRLSLGIQDFSPIVQKAINRIQTIEDVAEVTHVARELGYSSVSYDLIYGLPFQTLESVQNTFETVLALMPDRIAYYSYAHVPWLKPAQRGYSDADLPANNEKRALYELGCELLTTAGYHDIGMDHFALPEDTLFLARQNGTLHRNFMGYTTQSTPMLIGLGVSAISDLGTAYVQNAKVVEPYIEAVNEGRFPFFRGHLLTEEDVVLRSLIKSIMCRYEAQWEASEAMTELTTPAFKRLKELEADGLVIVGPESVKVTPLGIPFVRNVAMAFDARLWRKAPEENRFSMVV